MSHIVFLDAIKKSANLSYVSYERYGDKFRLKVIKNKGDKPDYFDLTGKPSDVTTDSYQKTLDKLVELYGAN